MALDQLFEAAKTGDVDTLKDVVGSGNVPLESSDKVGCTAVHWAAHRNQFDAVHYLVREGAPVNATDAQEKTALHFAAFRGNLAICEELVSYGALVDAQSKTGDTPLHLAAFKGHAPVIEFLLAKGASCDIRGNDGESALQKAALLRRTDAVRALVAGGADQEPLMRDRADSAFLAEVKSGRVAPKAVRAAPPAAKPATAPRAPSATASRTSQAARDANTLLLEAVRVGDNAKASRALQAGASVNNLGRGGSAEFPDSGEWTALHWAAYAGNTDLLRLLLDANADIGALDSYGFTPLHLAASKGMADAVQLLIDCDASVSQQCSASGAPSSIRGRAPIHTAACGGYVDVIELLVNNGAEVDAQDNATRTPLQLAAKYSQLQSVQVLLDKGADPALSTKLGATALHMAAWAGALEICKVLVDSTPGDGGAGSSPLALARDANDKTAADVAAARNHAQVSAYLSRVNLATAPPSAASRSASKVASRVGSPMPPRPSSAVSRASSKAPSGATLRKAAAAGDVARVKALLVSGIDAASTGTGAAIDPCSMSADVGWSALHWAAWAGSAPLIALLCDKLGDASVDSRTSAAVTPLHIAAMAGHKEAVQLLLQRGATSYMQATNGFTPAHYALAYSKAAVAVVLIMAMPQGRLDAASVGEGQTLLHLAASRGLGDVAKLLVARGANVALRETAGKTGAGRTALDWAAQEGQLDICRTLIIAGALVNVPDAPQAAAAADTTPSDAPPDTPSLSLSADVTNTAQAAAANALVPPPPVSALWHAVANGRQDITEYLLSQSARTDVRAPDGGTLLHIAAALSTGAVDMLRLLLTSDTSQVSVQDNAGRTPLHVAVSAGDAAVVQLLMDHGAQAALTDKAGRSAAKGAGDAARQDLVDILELPDNKAKLFDAVRSGDLAAVQAALSKGGMAVGLCSDGVQMDDRCWWSTDTNFTPLHWAAYAGSLEVAEYLVSPAVGADVHALSGSSNTALHAAAKADRMAVITLLLKSGAKVDAVNSRKQTPLHVAAVAGAGASVKALLKGAADYNAKDDAEDEALDSAAGSGNVDMVKELVRVGGEVFNESRGFYSALIKAAKGGHLLVCQYLVEAGADVATKDSSGYNKTPLHCAVEVGSLELVQYLLTKLNSTELVNAVDTCYSRTPLHYAADGNHLEIVRALVQHDPPADVSLTDSFSKTALHMAVANNNPDMVTLLLDKGALPDLSDGSNCPLYQAAMYGYSAVVRLLLAASVDVNATGGWQGYTPLMVATSNRATEVVQQLLDAGAQVATADSSGATALTLAIANSDTPVVQLLLDRGAAADVVNSSGLGVLHVAATSCNDNLDLIKLLAKVPGADPCAVSSYGQTPAELATSYGYEAAAKLLQQLEAEAAAGGAITKAMKLDLLNAARDGAGSRVEDLIFRGVPPSAFLPATSVLPDTNVGQGWTALHLAAHLGHTNVLFYLMQQQPIKVDACPGSDQATPLHAAVMGGQMAAVATLLSLGAEVGLFRSDGYNALHIAAECGHTKIAQMLIKKSADISVATQGWLSQTALHLAAAAGHADIVEQLLDQGAQVNVRDGSGKLPLLVAAKTGREAVVKLLLAKGAPVDERDERYNYTPLQEAAEEGHCSIVKMLVEAGADINIDDNSQSKAALAWAAQNGRVDVVTYLLSRPDVNANDLDTQGRSAIHAIVASKSGATDADLALVVAAFRAVQATVDVADNDGVTPLHLAAENGYAAVVRKLLACGAKADAATNSGMTPLLMAAKAGSAETAKALISEGADIKVVTSSGQSALHLAASAGALPLVTLLVNRGVALDQPSTDYYARYPLNCAAQNGHIEVAKYLVETVGVDPTLTDAYTWSATTAASQNGYSVLAAYLEQAVKEWEAKAPVKGSDAASLLKAATTGDVATVRSLVTGDPPKVSWDTPLAGLQYAQGTTSWVGSSSGEPVYTTLAGFTALHWAAYAGQLKVVAFLLSSVVSASVDVPDHGGRTPLHVAAGAGQREAAQLLLAAGASPLSRDKDLAAVPLLYAAMAGHAEVAQLLISKGSSATVVDSEGRSALHWAAQRGQVMVALYLLKKGALLDAPAANGRTALHLAVVEGHRPMVTALLKSAANPDICDLSGQTPLDLAVLGGDAEIVKALLRFKPKLTNPSNNSPSAVLAAAQAYNVDLCEMLLRAGASPDGAAPADGMTALMYAAMCPDAAKSLKLASLFLDALTNKESIDAGGLHNKRTALMIAAENNNAEVIKLLVDRGASVACVDSDSSTAFHVACNSSAVDAARALVQAGADVNQMDYNHTALHKAADWDRREVVKFLLACYDVSVDAKGGWAENTALHCAAQCSYVEVARLLLAAQASLTVTDTYGRTPLAAAVNNGAAMEMCQLLLSSGASCLDVDSYQRSLLHTAASNGNLDLCKLLVEKGCAINAINTWGQTPAEACPSYYPEVQAYLQGVEEASAANGAITKPLRKAFLSSVCDGALVSVQSYVDDSAVPLDSRIPGVALWDQAQPDDPKYNIGQGWTALHIAAFTGNGPVLAYLLERQAPLEAVADDGATPLFAAVLGNATDCLQALLTAGANVAAVRPDGQTALHLAAGSQHMDLVKMLLAQQADVLAVDQAGLAPLHVAAASGNLDIVKALLNAGGQVDMKPRPALKTALYCACGGRQTAVAQYLLQQGASVDSADSSGYTAFHKAAMAGHLDIVKLLMQAHANINKEDNDLDATALSLAAANGHLPVVDMLLEQPGVDIMDRDINGRSVLHVLSMSRQASDDTLATLARKLLTMGAEVNAVDSSGCTALRYAAGSGHLEVVKALVEAEADINAAGNDLQTALLAAATASNLQVCQYLVDCGADTGRVDSSGRTDLLVAADAGDLQLLRFFVNHGAAVNATNPNNQQSALHSCYSNKELATYLVDVAGADPTLVDLYGYTPAGKATAYGYPDVGSYLQQAQDSFSAQPNSKQIDPLLQASRGNSAASFSDLKALLDGAGAAPVALALPGMLMVEAPESLMSPQLSMAARWQAIHWAAHAGHAQAVRYLLSKGAVVDAEDAQGVTPLHVACWKGKTEVMKLLLSSQARVDAKSGGGLAATPLLCAAAAGRSEAVQVLLHNKADVSLTDSYGNSLLHWAARSGSQLLLQYLLKKVPQQLTAVNHRGQSVLHVAAEAGQAKSVLALIKLADADVNQLDSSNLTPLDGAAASGCVDALRYLIRAKAKLENAAQAGCHSSLLAAAQAGKVSAVEFLLAQGADPSLSDASGRNALHFAAIGGSATIITALCKTAKQPSTLINSVDSWWSRTPVHWAAASGQVEALKALAAIGASNVNVRDSCGYTPLMHAVTSGKNAVACIEFLLSCGADLALLATSPERTSAYWMAAEAGKADGMQALISAGKRDGSINIPGGWSKNLPLSRAVQRGEVALVQCLLGSPDVDVNACDDDGGTPLHAIGSVSDAAQRSQILQALLDAGVPVGKARTSDGRTALHVAAACNLLDSVQALVQYEPGCSTACYSQRAALAAKAAAQHTDAEAATAASAAILATKMAAVVHAMDCSGSSASEVAGSAGCAEVTAFLQQVEKDAIAQGAVTKADKQALLSAVCTADLAKVKALLAEKPMALDVCVPGWAVFDANPLPPAATVATSASGAAAALQPDPSFAGGKGWSALHIAAHNGSLEVLSYLISQKAPLNTLAPNDGLSALHVGASAGQLGALRLLLEAQAQATVATPEGLQPLHVAAQRGNLDIVRFFISQSAVQVDAATKSQATALHLAAQAGHTAVAQLLLDSGAQMELTNSDGCTPAMVAAAAGSTQLLRVLLKRGAAYTTTAGGSSALQLAAEAGHLDNVQSLIDAGADVNAAADGSCPALLRAAQRCHFNIVALLLSRGAAATFAMPNGQTALHILSSSWFSPVGATDRAATVQALIAAKAEVDVRDSSDQTPLFCAAGTNQADTVGLLLASSADPSAARSDANGGGTALTAACEAGAVAVVDLLIKAGAEIGVKASDGRTLLHLICQQWGATRECAELVWAVPRAAARIDVNAVTSSDGRTALHHAALRGSTDLVKWLLETARAKPGLLDSNAYSPAQTARDWGHSELADLLQAAEAAAATRSSTKKVKMGATAQK